MKISILANDGSPLGVTSKTIWGDHNRVGVGGAELALLTMCEEWTKVGHEVTLYNNPWEENASPFKQLPINAFDVNEPRDVLIIFRSPNIRSIPVNNCLKVWWSCDQQTVGNFGQFATTVDKIVCISPFHQDYFYKTYGITNTISIDLPVRVDDYKAFDFDKVPNRVIFTSVPARGLMNLWRIWPRIRMEVQDASLVITSDYRLWGVGPSNEHFKIKFLGTPGIEYLGAVPRIRLIEEELKAELFLYPSNYEELFCIACAEAQYAGAYPITTPIGALSSTNNMGRNIWVDPDNPANDTLFVKAAVEFLTSPDKYTKIWDIKNNANIRFSPYRILNEWDEKVFK